MRESGILLHITSLPSPNGIGTMGREAFEFIDFLKAAGQKYWQILPLTPTGYGNSPYQSCSTFAGNHYLIDLDLLAQEGLLKPEEYKTITWSQQPERADFGLLYENRLKVLRLAYNRFEENEDFKQFCRSNSHWLPDYALFMALKDQYGGKPWYEWEKPLKFRDPDALWSARLAFADEIRFYRFVQYLFHLQWSALRAYAHKNGIRIIGDVPIYVPYDSVEVWSSPELFQLDETLQPTHVAGCPPDAFTADGQLWGNPLYRWEVMAADGYSWWIRRLTEAGNRYDTIRFDHFRGFESYWAVPFSHETARYGAWVKGPNMDFISTIQKALPHIQLIAEDLGFLTPPVLEMLKKSGLPGMKVLGFAFDSREPSNYLPHTYTPNSVCYTGTHDNMTMRQWLETASEDSVQYAKEYMALTETEGLVWGVIRTAMSSVSNLCVVQMQDYLDLGGDARMNFPGTMSADNWTWRMLPGLLTEELAEKIAAMTQLYDRCGI